MIIPWNRINDHNDPFGYDIFRGEVMNDPAGDWRSRIPDLSSLGESALADPALSSQFGDFGDAVASAGSSGGALEQFIGELAMKDWIDGTRQTIGQIAQISGIVSTNLRAVQTIFTSDKNDLMRGFDLVGKALDSKAFNMAMDAVGAIPIVGWVIKIVFEISKAVAGVVEAYRDNKEAEARRQILKNLTIPMESIGFNPAANDMAAKAFFSSIQERDNQRIISPAYLMSNSNPSSGFEATGVYQKAGKALAAGWIVNGSQTTGGIGFVPGTSVMTRSLFFGTRAGTPGCNSVRDMGTLYPTAQGLCTTWWSNVNKPGPSMYSVMPLAAKMEWENYIDRMYGLARDLLKGWTCAPTSVPFSSKFECTSDVYGMGSCKAAKRGDRLTIPSDYGQSIHTILYMYLTKLFFGKSNRHHIPRINNQTYDIGLGSNNLYYPSDSMDISKSVPVKSLDVLYGNQRATLDSIQCMYIAADDRDRFPAFNDSQLRGLWEQAVTNVFSSGAWRRVSYQDMPEGEAKRAFKEYATARGVSNIEEFNAPCPPGEKCALKTNMYLSAGPQIPDEPSLPQKPQIDGSALQVMSLSGFSSGSRRKPSSALPIALAGGALAYMFLKSKR